MIRKTKTGFKVVSKKGKNLSKPGLSKSAAKKRLAQVEHFAPAALRTGEPRADAVSVGVSVIQRGRLYESQFIYE